VKVGSLFTGCAGLDLGLELAGHEIVWACESDRWCRQILNERRPGLEIYPDVRELDDGIPSVDILAGGFPCTDLSHAGKGAGLAGERSGLWFAFADTIRTLRPRHVIIENVPGLATKVGGRAGESATRHRHRRPGRSQGMWDSGFVYEVQTSERRTNENESLLLPTPVADDDGKSPQKSYRHKQNMQGGARKSFTSLQVLAKANFEQPRLLPTPGANDSTGPEKETRKARQEKQTGGNSLRDLPKLLPTPTTQDAHNNAGLAQQGRNSDPLNVAVLRTGESMSQQSEDGKQSSESELPHQLTIEDA
jgi:C-5 cytosine-specific DNA methylase